MRLSLESSLELVNFDEVYGLEWLFYHIIAFSVNNAAERELSLEVAHRTYSFVPSCGTMI